MEEKGNQQGSNASAAGVNEVPGEPTIIINGVPDITPSNVIVNTNDSSAAEETRPFGLGEWLEGREVRKWFMGKYYSGTVTEYDKQSGWYRVLYEDGDSEDLDWKELEEVLLPLDVTIPLKTLAQKIIRKGKKSVHKSGKSAARSKTPQVRKKATRGK